MKTLPRPLVATSAIIATAAALILLGAGSGVLGEREAPPEPTGSPALTVDADLGALHSGRSVCLGAIVNARPLAHGVAADLLEQVQIASEATLGFLAAVDDGAGPVVVVERDQLEAWVTRLAGTRLRVAPSCVAHEVLAGTNLALASIRLGTGEMTSSGYDAISDAMVITSTFNDAEMLAFLAPRIPSARAAYDEGTLRLVKVPKGSYSRQ